MTARELVTASVSNIVPTSAPARAGASAAESAAESATENVAKSVAKSGTEYAAKSAAASAIDIAPVSADQADALRDMTFPAYRHFLALQPSARHADDGDSRVVQPLGIAAWRDGEPLGLVMAEAPVTDGFPPEMLSLFVRPDARNRGIATALVSRLEAELHARGFARMEAVYMTGAAGIEALERVWQKCAWDAPAVRSVTVRFTPEQAASMPWFGRVRLPEPEFQIFPWTELTKADKVAIAKSQMASPWIPTELEPWRHDHAGFDDVSSVGLRFRGQVAGWVINHRLQPDFVRFTCSYMREDLSRRARILPLYTASVNRLLAAGGVRMCSMITPMVFEPMVQFVRDHIAGWSTFFGETRGTQKALGPASGTASAEFVSLRTGE